MPDYRFMMDWGINRMGGNSSGGRLAEFTGQSITPFSAGQSNLQEWPG